MNKEEILEKSREENKNQDIQRIGVELKACEIAAETILSLSFIFFVYEIRIGKGANPAFNAIISIYNCILAGYKAIKLKERRGLNTFLAVVWGLLTIMLLLQYFKVI